MFPLASHHILPTGYFILIKREHAFRIQRIKKGFVVHYREKIGHSCYYSSFYKVFHRMHTTRTVNKSSLGKRKFYSLILHFHV